MVDVDSGFLQPNKGSRLHFYNVYDTLIQLLNPSVESFRIDNLIEACVVRYQYTSSRH